VVQAEIIRRRLEALTEHLAVLERPDRDMIS